MQLVKQLVIVLFLASVVFYLARPIAEQFASKEDFARRRNIWLLLTAVEFLSPSFWLFVAIAAAVLIPAARRDKNPVCLYLLLLHVVPPGGVAIPFPIELFDLDNFRLLALTILLPLFFRLRAMSPAQLPSRGLTLPDYMLIGWGLLQVALFIPPDLPGHVVLHDSVTNMARRGLLFFFDVFILHYAVSRSCADRDKLLDACASLLLGLCVMSLLAVFESAKQWILYDGVTSRWIAGTFDTMYLLRGASLRAAASAGQPLVLGFCLAIGFGLWIGLQPLLKTRVQKLGTAALIWLGLLASYSRGPWMGALFMYVVFIVISARSLGPILKGGAVIVSVLGLVLISPFGDKIKAVLPFFGGKVDNFNVIYRQRLATRCWELISQSPFFGDQMAYFKLEDMRQGQGIIDFVNSFASIALFYGLIAVTLVFGYALLLAIRAVMRARRMVSSDRQFAGVGFALAATIAGSYLMLWATSFIDGPEKLHFILGAFCFAFLYAKAPAPATQPASVALTPRRAAAPRNKAKPWAPV